MRTANSAYDLAIVGGGIGGSLLAALCAAQGLQVIIIERNQPGHGKLHPEILWPDSARALNEVIPAEYADDWGVPVTGLVGSEDQHHLINLGPEFLQDAGVVPLSTNPSRTREFLLRNAQCEVHRGCEALDVIRDERSVRGIIAKDLASGSTFEISASLTVADDGAQSRIRDSAHLDVELSPFPVEVSTFAFTWPVNTPRQVRVILNSERKRSGLIAFAAFPWPHHEAAGLILWDRRNAKSPSEAASSDFSSRTPALCELIGMQSLPRHLPRQSILWGHAPHYGCPGLALLGDAAHPVSPAGGQGANMAIADALLLARLLRESAASDIVARYEALRRPANERSLSITRRAAKMLNFMSGTVSSYFLPYVFRQMNAKPQLLKRGILYAAQAFQTEALSPSDSPSGAAQQAM